MALAYSFCNVGPGVELHPNPGDVLFAAHTQRATSACLDLLERGKKALQFGEGPPQRIVIRLSEDRPNLDDMLGAAMLRLWHAQQLAPEQLRRFGEYAASARHGLCFPQLPLERSLQGIFLASAALSWQDDHERTSREAANQFLQTWISIERTCVKAARQQRSPHDPSLFEAPRFLAQRLFLAQDREVFRADLSRGQLWRLPDGRCGLLLRAPHSKLYPHWLRCEARASLDGRFGFLAVRRRAGWRIDSDPLGSLPLDALASQLNSQGQTWRLSQKPDGSQRVSCATAVADQSVIPSLEQSFGAQPCKHALEGELQELKSSWPFEQLGAPELPDVTDGRFLARSARNTVVSVDIVGLHLPRSDMSRAQELVPLMRQTRSPRAERVVRLLGVLRENWRGRPVHGLVSRFWTLQTVRVWREMREGIRLSQLIALITDVAEGLAFYNQLGLTYADLNLDNVLIKLDGGVFRACLDLPGWVSGLAFPQDDRFYTAAPGDITPHSDLRGLMILVVYLIYGSLPQRLLKADGSGFDPELLDEAEAAQLVEDTDARWFRELAQLLDRAWSGQPRAMGPEAFADAFGRITEDVIPTLVVDPGPSSRYLARGPQEEDDDEEFADVPEQSSQEEGFCLGDVLLHEKIATGGFADVYLGYHQRMHCEVAVKVLSKRGMEQEASVVERFVNEALLCAKIESPHLVKVFEVDEDKGLHYLVMEFIDGWTAHTILCKVVQKGYKGLTENLALCIGESCARGLADLHAYGIVHRDVKPANIMVPKTAGNRPDVTACKLIDLGLAKEPQLGLTTTGVSFGTLGFMPPEQVGDAKDVCPATDVFSLGATLYQLLTARQPFEGDTPADIVASTMEGNYVPLSRVRPDISPATCAALERCLAHYPSERYKDGNELQASLRQIRHNLRRSRT